MDAGQVQQGLSTSPSVSMKEKVLLSANTIRNRIFRLFLSKEGNFLKMILAFFMIAAIFYPYPKIAMWIGFAFAGYSAIANDSIQTIGTFLASNAHRKWWHLWLYIGSIFVATVAVSWAIHNGDVSFQRLQSKGFSVAPESFVFLQLAAPVILLILTRLKMPVSTTFLILSAFSTSAKGVMGVMTKSLCGYMVAFGAALFIYTTFGKYFKKMLSNTTNINYAFWVPYQWIISGALWSVWVMQDAANIAIFLPRSLSVAEFIGFAGFIFLGLGVLFYLKGDKIQEVVNEKTEIADVRGASIIDTVYTAILFFFQVLSKVPMSTTWVFLGLLAGRELGMQLVKHNGTQGMRKTCKMIGKDVGRAFVGLVISIILAFSVNPKIGTEVLENLTSLF